MSIFSVTNQGVITVDTSLIREDFQNAYKESLGSNLRTDSRSIVGQLITNDTETLTQGMEEVVKISNSFSVYYAKGRALDVAAAFFGYYRKKGTGTTVTAILSGKAGTVITEGSLVSDAKNQFSLLDTVVIGQDGTAEAYFQCIIYGSISCNAGTLTQIVTPIVGWDHVTNPTDGILGYETESDNEFRYRITLNWLNIRARSILGAIIDNVYALEDVVTVLGRENPGDSPITIDDITLKPHSIYICVLGGKSSEIAKVLAQQKTLGAGVNGNTTISYYDPDVDYIYNYLIQRPTLVNIGVQVQYTPNTFTPTGVNQQIKQLIIEWISKNPFKIGQTISGNLLAQALNGFNQINLLSFKVKTSSSENYMDYIQTSISQVGVLNVDDITIEVV